MPFFIRNSQIGRNSLSSSFWISSSFKTTLDLNHYSSFHFNHSDPSYHVNLVNVFIEHPLDGRSAVFKFCGTCFQVTFDANGLISCTRFMTNTPQFSFLTIQNNSFKESVQQKIGISSKSNSYILMTERPSSKLSFPSVRVFTQIAQNLNNRSLFGLPSTLQHALLWSTFVSELPWRL